MNVTEECNVCIHDSESECQIAIQSLCLKGYMSRYDCLHDPKNAVIKLCLDMNIENPFEVSYSIVLWPAILMGIIAFIQVITYNIFMRYSVSFKNSNREKKIKIVFNVNEIIITLFSLIYIFISFPIRDILSVNFWDSPMSDLSNTFYDVVNSCVIPIISISLLYFAELLGIPNLRLPLIAHHVCVITLFILTMIIYLYQSQIRLLISAGRCFLPFILFAITEQPIFIFMITYRLLDPKKDIEKCTLLLLKSMYYINILTRIFIFVFALSTLIWYSYDMSKYHDEVNAGYILYILLLSASFICISWAQFTTYIATKKMLRKFNRRRSKTIIDTIQNNNLQVQNSISYDIKRGKY